MHDQIKTIIVKHFQIALDKIESDFNKNYTKKVHNFLLNQFDPEIIAEMVFVSSFESKSGNAIQACAKDIAILKFGNENVPMIVNPNHLSCTIDESKLKEQIVITNVNLDKKNGKLHGEIAKFRDENSANGAGKERHESTINQEKLNDLLEIANENIHDRIHTKPVDLAFYDGGHWNLLEIKAGGDLDSSNAPSNIAKLLTLYVALNQRDSNLYFATIYNKNGEGNNWTGIAKNYLNYPSMFLIGSKFWEKILPEDFSFQKFTKVYKEALEEINLNQRICKLIKAAE